MTDLSSGLTSRRTILRAGAATIVGGVSILTLGAGNAHAAGYTRDFYTLREGCHVNGNRWRDMVAMMQERLNAYRSTWNLSSMPYLTVDGNFGSMTKKAVIGYQSHKGLVADGIAGSATLSALTLSRATYQYTSGGYPYFMLGTNKDLSWKPVVRVTAPIRDRAFWGM